MKVLLLCPYPAHLTSAIKDSISSTNDEWSETEDAPGWADLTILWGWRKILPAEEIAARGRVINIHISLLPWNRGACPNLFSWYYGTPKGVSIHRAVPKVDAGPVLAQRELIFPDPEKETLKTSYDALQNLAVRMFAESWSRIRGDILGDVMTSNAGGSYHTILECNELMKHFPLGIDTPVMDVVRFGLGVDT